MTKPRVLRDLEEGAQRGKDREEKGEGSIYGTECKKTTERPKKDHKSSRQSWPEKAD